MKIRQGNAFTIFWTVTINGGVTNLSELSDVLIEIKNPIGQTFYPNFIIHEDNKIEIPITTKMEQWTGLYHISCWINKGTDNQAVVDCINCFEIVDKATKNIEIVSFINTGNSDVILALNGKSAYDIAVSKGFEGTEDEWLESLNKPAIDAFDKVTSIIDELATKDEIPTKLSALDNDTNYITLSEVPEPDFTGYATEDYVSEYSKDFAKKGDIPSKTSDLLNDAGFLTEHQTLPDYSNTYQAKGNYANAEHTHSQYLTEHQSLAGYATEEWVTSKNYLTTYTDTIYDDTDVKNRIETLENAGFLTEHQTLPDYSNTYQAKGNYANAEHTHSQYLTEHQSLAGYATKDELQEIKLFKFPNATIYGEPTINNGQISNFSANNYLQFPFVVNFQNKPYEINACFTTGNNVTSQENIFDSNFGLAFAIINGHFVLATSTNGSSWNLGAYTGTYSVQPKTTYYVKISWDGINETVKYSINNVDYFNDITVNSIISPYPKQITIGKSVDNKYIFSGIINLNYCSLTISNKIVWTGMDDVGLASRLAVDLSNIDIEGEQKIKNIIGQIPEMPDLSDYYTKDEADSNFATKDDLDNVRNEFPPDFTTEINDLTNNKLDSYVIDSYYTKDEVDGLLENAGGGSFDSENYYDKTEIDDKFDKIIWEGTQSEYDELADKTEYKIYTIIEG